MIRSAGVPQSANPYSYTENNPVNGVDPTGAVTYVNNTTDCGGGCTMVHFTSGSLAANSGDSVVGSVETTNSAGETTTIQVTGNQFANMSPAGQNAFIKGSGQSFGAVGNGTFEAGTESFFGASQSGGPGQTTIDLNYSTIDGIPGARHAFGVITGPDGQQVGFRGGPEARDGGLGSPGSSGGNGLFGNLTTQVAPIGPDFLDTNANVVASQRVLTTNQPFSKVVGAISNFSTQVNAAGIRYNPLGANSNAFAHQAVTVLRAARPPPIVFAPGANTVLRLP